jgi:hypothetical protein
MTIPLGATPVLDHGWIKLLSCSPNGKELQEIRTRYYRGTIQSSMVQMTQIAIEMNVPMFVRLAMGRIPFVLKPFHNYEKFYNPTVADIGSGSLETDKQIQESIQMTMDALIVNQETYVSDGCNNFVAMMTVPTSSYVSGIAYGTMGDWMDFISQAGAPNQVKAYQDSIRKTLAAEFTVWEEIEKRRGKL